MSPTSPRPAARTAVHRIGCVSYLNARPLIEGVDALPDARVKLDVPSRLLEDLETGLMDIALCPVIDYFRSRIELDVVPVGGIGSDGPTLTVRLFSRIPIEQITTIYVDTDSHTSVALLRVLLAEKYGLHPQFIDYHAREQVANHRPVRDPQAMLLIGDKVINSAPDDAVYPHQLDLGGTWRELTGLPFVFAVWMTPRQTHLGDLPRLLREQRDRNLRILPEIASRAGAAHHWPADMARRYLCEIMRYTISEPERLAMEQFGMLAHRHGLIDHLRPLRYRE